MHLPREEWEPQPVQLLSMHNSGGAPPSWWRTSIRVAQAGCAVLSRGKASRPIAPALRLKAAKQKAQPPAFRLGAAPLLASEPLSYSVVVLRVVRR